MFGKLISKSPAMLVFVAGLLLVGCSGEEEDKVGSFKADMVQYALNSCDKNGGAMYMSLYTRLATGEHITTRCKDGALFTTVLKRVTPKERIGTLGVVGNQRPSVNPN